MYTYIHTYIRSVDSEFQWVVVRGEYKKEQLKDGAERVVAIIIINFRLPSVDKSHA